jgi:hypothetical protein
MSPGKQRHQGKLPLSLLPWDAPGWQICPGAYYYQFLFKSLFKVFVSNVLIDEPTEWMIYLINYDILILLANLAK